MQNLSLEESDDYHSWVSVSFKLFLRNRWIFTSFPAFSTPNGFLSCVHIFLNVENTHSIDAELGGQLKTEQQQKKKHKIHPVIFQTSKCFAALKPTTLKAYLCKVQLHLPKIYCMEISGFLLFWKLKNQVHILVLQFATTFQIYFLLKIYCPKQEGFIRFSM